MTITTAVAAENQRQMKKSSTADKASTIAVVPVIDVFAGCGGFSEGFQAYADGTHRFDVSLAVDSDAAAHHTHRLRTFFHQFSKPPKEYYALLRREIILEELFCLYAEQAEAADNIVRLHELGKDAEADAGLQNEIGTQVASCKNWVLIGGPPCQAYSIAGRSRNRGKPEYRAEDDHRHFLYLEYLRIIASHLPAVFVMENVPGILSAKLDGTHIWPRILEDLADPVNATGLIDRDTEINGYRLYSLVEPITGIDIFGRPTLKPDDYIVRCEHFGIPQARHRVFIVGIRSDINVEPQQLKRVTMPTPCGKVLDDLPPLRSGLTRTADSDENWLALMNDVLAADWWATTQDGDKARRAARQALKDLSVPSLGRGGEFVNTENTLGGSEGDALTRWIRDPRLSGICNHFARGHMQSDVMRYVFAASHSMASAERLSLAHFPKALLPQHENVQRTSKKVGSSQVFTDRFSVQQTDQPADTITSHIAKDGHYYIHPDASQARSLTVREAARIQTFPDNFYFPGTRTEQYRQIGNAVPPFLALQIAAVVDDILHRASS